MRNEVTKSRESGDEVPFSGRGDQRKSARSAGNKKDGSLKTEVGSRKTEGWEIRSEDEFHINQKCYNCK